jgi:hypothetical protein
MRCTVVWDPAAQDDLARIWMRATDQQAVADAADEIDLLLRFSALDLGEEVGADRRLIREPLMVVYTVSPEDCLVRVLTVAFLG